MILAVTSAGPDASRDSILELVLGNTHVLFQWTAIRGGYEELKAAVDNGLLADCLEHGITGGFSDTVETLLANSDPEPILCFNPWGAAIPHMLTDFGIKPEALSHRLIDVRAWGRKEPALTLRDLAADYGIIYHPTGRAQDEADLIERIQSIRLTLAEAEVDGGIERDRRETDVPPDAPQGTR